MGRFAGCYERVRFRVAEKQMNNVKLFLLLLSISFYGTVFAVEIETVGEAVIIDNDKSSAKAAALSRAKWFAVEMASPAKIKIDTVINNAELADEAVKTELSATIKSYDILEETINGNRYIIRIKADVIPETAKAVVDGISGNTSICVMIAGIMPDSDSLLFDQPFSSAVINQLNEKGFKVDLIDYSKINANTFLAAFNNMADESIDKLVNSSVCRNILMGKLTISDMGNDVGYGTVSFKIVSGDLNWKLVEKQNKKINILSSGFFSGKAQGATLNIASMNIYKSMANNTAVKLVSQVSEKILGDNYKSIRVVLTGSNTAVDDLRDLKEDLKNIPFVLQIKEQNENSLVVDYPDKSYYLAVFLERNNKYKVIKLNDNELIIRK